MFGLTPPLVARLKACTAPAVRLPGAVSGAVVKSIGVSFTAGSSPIGGWYSTMDSAGTSGGKGNGGGSSNRCGRRGSGQVSMNCTSSSSCVPRSSVRSRPPAACTACTAGDVNYS